MEEIKSLDELQVENATLTEEVNKLKEKLNLLDKDGKELERIESILSENTLLKERADKAEALVNELTEERNKDKNIMVDLMRNYSMRKNDPGFFGDDGKSDDEKRYEEARDAMNNWVENFKENGIKL